jgi:hypothetical protein
MTGPEYNSIQYIKFVLILIILVILGMGIAAGYYIGWVM